MSRRVPVCHLAAGIGTVVWGVTVAGLVAMAPTRAVAGPVRDAPDTWGTLALLPFTYGVSSGGGLATDGTYLYAADFSGDSGWDYVDLNGNLARDDGELLWELGLANGSVRVARYDPASGVWEALPTLNAAGIDGNAFSEGNLVGPLFVAAGRLCYYLFQAGPNRASLYSYDLASGTTGAWSTVWQKWESDAPLIGAGAGLCAAVADGQPVILHHIGGGAYDFVRTDNLAGGGTHTQITPTWDFTGAHFPRCGSWAYDSAADRLYHMSGDQLLSWTHDEAAYPGGSLLHSVPTGTQPLAVETIAIDSLHTAFGWWTSSSTEHPGTSLWGNSLALVNEASGQANGPGGEDTGDRVLYLVRGESSPDTWPFNEGRGTPYTQCGRYFVRTGAVQDLPELPFAAGKGSCSAYLDGFLYVTQGDTLTVADDPENVEPMNREGIRRPGRGLARFCIRPEVPPDTTPPEVTGVSPSGTVHTAVDAIDLTFSEPVPLAGEAFVQVAESLVVDLRAVDLDELVWPNHGSLGDLLPLGPPAPVTLGGVLAVPLDSTAFIGASPPATLTGSSDRTIEAWVYNPAIGADEETVVAWGRRGADRQNLAFAYGSTWGATHWGDDLTWDDVAVPGAPSEPPAAAAWHHLAYTYDGGTTVCVYVDGALRLRKTLSAALDTAVEGSVVLGAQNAADGSLSPGEHGTLAVARVRVHGGCLTAAQVAGNYAAEAVDFGLPGASLDAALDRSDLGLSGPLGPIALTGIEAVSETVCRLHFGSQSLDGDYALVLHPSFADLAGNPPTGGDRTFAFTIAGMVSPNDLWRTWKGTFPSEAGHEQALGYADGDPYLDLGAVAGDTCTVWSGLGDGTFAGSDRATEYSPFYSAPDPYTVLADVTGDGIGDLLYFEYQTNTLVVHVGTGDGRFGAVVSAFSLGQLAYEIQPADFNGDGLTDVAVRSSAGARMLVNTGSGSFTQAAMQSGYLASMSLGTGIVAGRDTLLACEDSSTAKRVHILTLPASGPVDHRTVNTTIGPTAAVLSDLDGDGTPDLAVASWLAQQVRVFLGSGTSFVPGQTIELGFQPIRLAELPGRDDGFPNLAVSDGQQVLLLRHDGTADLTVGESYQLRCGDRLVKADVNGDGIPDLLGSNGFCLGDGDGGLRAARSLPTSAPCNRLATADLDADAVPDLVALHTDAGTATVLLMGGRMAPRSTASLALGGHPSDLLLASLLGNAAPDLAIVDSLAGSLRLLPGNGDGTFGAGTTIAVGAGPSGLTAADVDGDGRTDLAVACRTAGQIWVALAQADGSFALGPPVTTPAGPAHLAAADLDGDGDLDLLVACATARSLQTLLGDGHGAFAVGPVLAAQHGLPTRLAVADVNRDGRPDVATVEGRISHLYLGNGDGSFRASDLSFTNYNNTATDVLFADFNGDGSADLLTVCRWTDLEGGDVPGDACFVAYGNGRGGLLGTSVVQAGYGPVCAAALDLNRDGALDFAVGSLDADRLTWVPNLRPVSHSPHDAALAPVQALNLHFARPMETGSFDPAADIAAFTGPGGPVALSTVEWPDPSHLRLGFAPVSAPGVYRLVLEPGLMTVAGSALDVDGDGTPGEVPDDRYAASFRIPAATPDPGLPVETNWSGTVLVTGSVRVPANVRLTVAAGTLVKLQGGNTSLDVLGELVVAGTVAAPVIFTSVNDDTGGTVPGSTGNPQAGDWGQIHLSNGAHADIANARFCWGGGGTDTSRGGFLRVESRATATVTNCTFEHATYSGFVLWDRGTAVTVTNSVIRDCNFAVLADWDTVIDLIHCTLDANVVAVRGHGGTYNLANCIVSNSIEAGIDSTGPPTTIALNRCNVWSPEGANYRNWPDQTGLHGNLAVDPVYRDQPAGILALGPGSPMIDAADGTASPAADFYNLPRYDDPRTPNTGTPTPTGAFADLGAFEFVENAPSDIDLVVTAVTGPAAAMAGETVTVSWTVRNDGTAPAHGAATDRVYLVGEENAVLEVGDAPWNAALAAGASVARQAVLRLPPCVSGAWRFRVLTNADREVFEGQNGTNNATTAAQPTTVGVPALAPGLPLDLSLSDGPAVAALAVPADTTLAALLRGADRGDVLFLGGLDRVPTQESHDLASVPWPGPELLLGAPPAPVARTLYLLVQRRTASLAAVTLELYDNRLRLLAAGVPRSSVTAPIAVPLLGCGFAAGMTATLAVEDGRGVVPAEAVTVVSPWLASARFDPRGLDLGAATLELASGEQTAALPGAVDLVPGGQGPHLTARLVVPSPVRPSRPYTLWLEYENTGDAEMPSPLFRIESYGTFELQCPGCGQWRLHPHYLIVGVNPFGPDPAVLPPGFRYRLPIPFRTLPRSDYRWALSVQEATDDPIDWDAMEATIRPAIPPADWPLQFAELKDRLGNTWASYLAALHDQARRRFAAGIPIPCAERCFESLAKAPDYLVAGRLVDDRTGQAVAGVAMQIASDREDDVVAVLAESGPDGRFCFDSVPEAGSYCLSADGYRVTAGGTATVVARDVLDQEVRVLPAAAAELAFATYTGPRYLCRLTQSAAGELTVAYIEGDRLRLATLDGEAWHYLTTPGDPTHFLAEADVVPLPEEAQGEGADWFVVYTHGGGGSGVLYGVWVRRDPDGTIVCTAPEALTGDSAGDSSPRAVALPDGPGVLYAWAQRDSAIDDDPDLYGEVLAIPSTLVAMPAEALAPTEFGRTRGYNFTYRVLELGLEVPKDIPLLGGSYLFRKQQMGLIDDSNCKLFGLLDGTGTFRMANDSLPINNVDFSGHETWKVLFDVPEDRCDYAFVYLQGGGTGHMAIEFPAGFAKKWVEKGARLAMLKVAQVVRRYPAVRSWYLKGSKWMKSNIEMELPTGGLSLDVALKNMVFRGPDLRLLPQEGTASLDVKASLRTKISLKAERLFTAAGNVSGEAGCLFSVYLPAPVPSPDNPHGKLTCTLKVTPADWIKAFGVPEINIPEPGTSRDASDEEPPAVDLEVAVPVGSTNVYEGTPLLPLTEANTTFERDHRLAVSPGGEVLLAFTRLEGEPGSVRRPVCVSNRGAEGFGPPACIDARPLLCETPTVLFTASGQPVVAYAASPANGLAGKPGPAVLEAALLSTAVYAVARQDGVWQAPVLLTDMAGTNGSVCGATGPGGQLAVGWLNYTGDDPALWVAFSTATGWSVPAQVVSRPGMREPQLAFTGAGVLVAMWEEDEALDEETSLARIVYACHTDAGWGALQPFAPPIPAPSSRAVSADSTDARAGAKLSLLPTPPDECCEDEEDDEDESNDTQPDPPPPPPPPGPDGNGRNLVSEDPNDKDAPVGYGSVSGGRYVLPDQEFTFVIHFENLATAATAAQEVRIADQLPTGMDWGSFALGAVGVGDQVRDDLDGLAAGILTFHQASTGLDVRVEAQSHPATGAVSWYLRCLDPNSADGWPADPYAGFLPPNVHPPEGEGWVSYRLRPAAPLPDGTVVSGPRATITFDHNPPIETNATAHTVDASVPVSAVLGVRKTGLGNSVRLQVHVDDGAGAGLGRVELLAATGERTAVLATSLGGDLEMTGDWGASYDLRVRAVDGVGNAEPIPAAPSATVRIPQWAFRMGVSGDGTDELFVGLAAAAGEGWDAGLDEETAAVRRSESASHIALAGPAGHAALRYDVRPPAAVVRWQAVVPPAGDGRRDVATLSWDPGRVPAGRFMWWVHLDAAGVPVPDTFVDAASASTLTAAAGRWELTLADNPPLTATLRRGWNLLSLPVEPSTPAVGALFGSRAAGGLAWVWGAGGGRDGAAAWTPSTEVVFGQGVAIFAGVTGQVLVRGTPPVLNAVALQPGWNLVGVAAPCRLPADPRLGTAAFLWVSDTSPPAYQEVDILLPWNAYWLYWGGDQAEVVEFPEGPP